MSSATWAGVAPFCGAKTRGGVDEAGPHVAGRDQLDARAAGRRPRRPGRHRGRRPSWPSRPSPTMIRSAPPSSAAAISSPVPWVVAAMGSLPSAPPDEGEARRQRHLDHRRAPCRIRHRRVDRIAERAHHRRRARLPPPSTSSVPSPPSATRHLVALAAERGDAAATAAAASAAVPCLGTCRWQPRRARPETTARPRSTMPEPRRAPRHRPWRDAMPEHDLSTIDAVDQAALVRDGQVSPAELVDAAIDRIETVDPRAQRRDPRALRAGPGRGRRAGCRTAPSEACRSCSRTSPCDSAGDPYHAGTPVPAGARLPAPTTTATSRRSSGPPACVAVGRTNTPELGTTVTTESLA